MARATRIAKLTRVRVEPRKDSPTLFFRTPAMTQKKSVSDFIRPDLVPEFEGEEAWFEMEWVSEKPRGYWKPARQVAAPPSRAGE